MYLVGMTGGIGSGKSAAAERFGQHQVTIVNSDQIAREVVLPGTPALSEISGKFGHSVLQADGSLDRAALRKKIFDDDSLRSWLEGLLHPLIGRTTDQRLNAPRRTDEPPYRILESPLLLEVGGHDRVQRILLIDCEMETRIARIIQRDNTTREHALAIIEAQMPDHQKRELADDIVDNSGSYEKLFEQIDTLHQSYCQLASQH